MRGLCWLLVLENVFVETQSGVGEFLEATSVHVVDGSSRRGTSTFLEIKRTR